MDSNDPFDSSQQWGDVRSNSPWTNNTSADDSTTPNSNRPGDSHTSSRSSVHHHHHHGAAVADHPTVIPSAPHTLLAEPSAPSLFEAETVMDARVTTQVTTFSNEASSSSSAAAAKAPAKHSEEELPPSYEFTMKSNIPQIHDNYAHLIGPPGQRGDVKVRIPLDSTPASHYQEGGSGSGSGSRLAEGSAAAAQYGAISPSSPPSSGRSNNHASPNRLQGQVSQGRDDDDLHSRDVDRLLGPGGNPQSGGRGHLAGNRYEEEERKSYWSIVYDGKAWMALVVVVVVLLPWAIFCFLWTLITGITAGLTMIVPPIGYVATVAVITTWRALAKFDLFMARQLVGPRVVEENLYEPPSVFITLSDDAAAGGGGASRRRTRDRDCGARHASVAWNNPLTVKILFYFLLGKFLFGLVMFVGVLVLGVFTIPLLICLLPLLLRVGRKVMVWQFQWAIFWLAKKAQPIALP